MRLLPGKISISRGGREYICADYEFKQALYPELSENPRSPFFHLNSTKESGTCPMLSRQRDLLLSYQHDEMKVALSMVSFFHSTIIFAFIFITISLVPSRGFLHLNRGLVNGELLCLVIFFRFRSFPSG